ncbi:MAG: glycosyltransferase family 4 protein [Caldilineaceae bacterium]|nr:glycosyltransferase family 4 protein [Caldilineaceae bacterium]
MTIMHILFITGEYPPMRGGVGAYTACLAEALQRHGARVSILTGVDAQRAAHSPHRTRTDTLIFGQRRWWPTIWYSIPRLARTIGADWIHIQYQTAAFAMNPSINLAPTVWRSIRPLLSLPPIAWTYHDLLVPYLFPKAGAQLRRWVTAQPAHHSALTIVTNEADRIQLQAEQGVDAVKIPIGSNIMPPQLAPDVRAKRRAQRNYEDGQLVLGYFGFLNRSKGGITLIQTLDRLVQRGYDAHLLMIGERVGASDPTNFAYLHEVETLIGSRGLGKRVRWTGHQSADEVSKDLAAIDLLLMPYVDGASLRRGTLMAGLAHGCAIVTTTPQGPLSELTDGQEVLFISPENPIAAADAVARLAENPTLRQILGQRAQQKSLQFTWDAIAQSHLHNYSLNVSNFIPSGATDR